MYLPVLDKINHNQEYQLNQNDYCFVLEKGLLPLSLSVSLFCLIIDYLILEKIYFLLIFIPLLFFYLSLVIFLRILTYRKLKNYLINHRYRLKLFTFRDIINDTLADTIVSLAFSYEDETDPCTRMVIAEYQRSNLPPFQSAEENRICEIFPLIKGDTFKTPYGLSLQIVEIEKDLTDDSVTGVTLEVTNFRRFSIIWKIF